MKWFEMKWDIMGWDDIKCCSRHEMKCEPTWNKDLLMSPVELELVIAYKGVDEGRHRRRSPGAYIVKVEHALYSA